MDCEVYQYERKTFVAVKMSALVSISKKSVWHTCMMFPWYPKIFNKFTLRIKNKLVAYM